MLYWPAASPLTVKPPSPSVFAEREAEFPGSFVTITSMPRTGLLLMGSTGGGLVPAERATSDIVANTIVSDNAAIHMLVEGFDLFIFDFPFGC